MRNDNHTANLFAAFGQGQGNVTVSTRIARLALVLADALSSAYARLERSFARPPITRVAVRPSAYDVVVKRIWAGKMRSLHAHFLHRGEDQRLWLSGCRMSPVMCSVS